MSENPKITTEDTIVINENTAPSFSDISSGDTTSFDMEALPDLNQQQPKEEFKESFINGVNWKSHRKNIQRKEFTLNNGEPASLAVKRIATEVFLCIFTVLLILVAFFARQFTYGKLIDEEYDSFLLSSAYSAVVSFDNLNIQAIDSEDSQIVYSSLSSWANIPADDQVNISSLPFVFTNQLNDLLGDYNFSLETNISNYSFLCEIYDNLKEDKPVVVNVANYDNNAISYAFVTKIDTNSHSISLAYTDGNVAEMTFEDFFVASNYSEIENLSFRQKMFYLLGLYNVNSAFFITDGE